jgi:hypothetical protein
MNKFLFLVFCAVCATAAAQTVASVENLDAIQIIDGQGVWSPPQPLETLWQTTALRTPLRNMLQAKLAWYDPLTAKQYLAAVQARGAVIPQATIDNVTARIETLRQQKETALMTVKDTNPQRALVKMQDLLMRGLPITQTTQNAVNTAAGVSPTPIPTATPAPGPEPNDGL